MSDILIPKTDCAHPAHLDGAPMRQALHVGRIYIICLICGKGETG